MQGKHARHAKNADDIQQTETPAQAASNAVDANASGSEPTAVVQPAAQPVAAPATVPIAPPGQSAAIFSNQMQADAATASVNDAANAATVGASGAVPQQPTVALPVESAGVQAEAVPQTVADAAANLSVIGTEGSAFAGIEVRKKRRGVKAFLITLCIIVVFLAVAYGVGVYIFSQHFLPGTMFGDVNVSMMGTEEVQQIIEEQVDDYQLDVVGGSFSYRATSKDLGLTVDAAAMAQEMLDSQSQWQWPLLFIQNNKEVSSQYTVSYDVDALEKALTERLKTYNEGATPSKNATVVYDESSDAFVVQPDVTGTQYQPQAVVNAAENAITTLTPLVTLTEEQLIPAEIRADDPKLVEASQEATKMVSAHLHLKLDGEDAGEIGPDDLHNLIRFDENLNVSLDEDELSVWIDGVVKRYDTVGTERTYTRPDGKEITVSGGEYGWQVDQDALREAVLDCVYNGSDTTMDIPCWQTAQEFNGQGNPDWGKRYADVDLSEQYVRFYDENGDLVWESACITGMPDGEHNTVEGVWYIVNKESPSKLVGRDRNGNKEYETMVTYWMAFEYNAIGFHDATWQPAFGGSLYAQGYGSHGCVNLPYYAAEELYGIIDWDDVVIVHW